MSLLDMCFRGILPGPVLNVLRLRAKHDIIGCKGTSGPLASFDLAMGYHPLFMHASVAKAPSAPWLPLHLLDGILSERRLPFFMWRHHQLS